VSASSIEGGGRIALFSDVHGNMPALEAVLADTESRGLDLRYCLGDLVGYGTDPNGVASRVQALDIPVVLGNYDEGVAWETGDCGCFYPSEEAKRVGEASYRFTVSAVAEENKAWLRGLPRELRLTIGGIAIHVVHGSPRRINEYLLAERDERTYHHLARTETADVLAFGHTHQLWRRRFDGKLFVNVGSVGRPKDGDARAGYVILEAQGSDVGVEFVRVSYDVEEAARAVLEAGLPPSLAAGLRNGR
jgi:putative phosphoesterase